MSLVVGINELRSLISTPRDPLYQHLTDLIIALEEADVPNPSTNGGSSKRPDVSCSKRKVRRKKDKKVHNDNISNVKLVEPSSNHSPCNAGSESSAEEIVQKKQLFSPNATVEMSDSEGEYANRRSSGTNWLKPDLSRICLGQRNNTTLGVPVESDSFTETITPARHQRRKRLIKRMVVDSAGEVDFGCGTGLNQRRHSASMEMDVSNSLDCSPKYPKKLRFRKTGSCHSESSMDCNSSSSESDGNTSDAGRQGDDEQSDWYFEFPKANQQDECMGVPNIRKLLMCKARRESGLDQANVQIVGGSTFESSDTDMSQSSCCLQSSIKYSAKRLMSKSGPSMSSALNKRLVNFIRDSKEVELQLGTLRKREKKEALRLASFYHLEVRCKTSKSVQTYTMVKTKYSLWPL